jgi:hypothetical protein
MHIQWPQAVPHIDNHVGRRKQYGIRANPSHLTIIKVGHKGWSSGLVIRVCHSRFVTQGWSPLLVIRVGHSGLVTHGWSSGFVIRVRHPTQLLYMHPNNVYA